MLMVFPQMPPAQGDSTMAPLSRGNDLESARMRRNRRKIESTALRERERLMDSEAVRPRVRKTGRKRWRQREIQSVV